MKHVRIIGCALRRKSILFAAEDAIKDMLNQAKNYSGDYDIEALNVIKLSDEEGYEAVVIGKFRTYS